MKHITHNMEHITQRTKKAGRLFHVPCSMFHGEDRGERGFTLIEFIVYTAIVSLIILFLFEFLTGIIVNQSKTRLREAVITNATIAINAIDSEIRHAGAVYSVTSAFGTSPVQLSLVTAKNLPNQETESYVDIFLDSDSRLCIKREIAGVQCVSSDRIKITNLQFNKASLSSGEDSGVQTILTVEYNTENPDLANTFTLQSFARLRN